MCVCLFVRSRKHEYFCTRLVVCLLWCGNVCFHGCNCVKLYMSAHGDTREDYNEALMMQHLSFRVSNHGNRTTLCRWIFDVKERGWYWETGAKQMSASAH